MNNYRKSRRDFNYEETGTKTIKKPRIINNFSSQKPDVDDIKFATASLSLLKLKMKNNLKSSKSIPRENITNKGISTNQNKRNTFQISMEENNERNFRAKNENTFSYNNYEEKSHKQEPEQVKRIESKKNIVRNLPITQNSKYSQKYVKNIREDFRSTLNENKQNMTDTNPLKPNPKNMSFNKVVKKTLTYEEKQYQNKIKSYKDNFEKEHEKNQSNKKIDHILANKKFKKENNKDSKMNKNNNYDIKNYYQDDNESENDAYNNGYNEGNFNKAKYYPDLKNQRNNKKVAEEEYNGNSKFKGTERNTKTNRNARDTNSKLVGSERNNKNYVNDERNMKLNGNDKSNKNFENNQKRNNHKYENGNENVKNIPNRNERNTNNNGTNKYDNRNNNTNKNNKKNQKEETDSEEYDNFEDIPIKKNSANERIMQEAEEYEQINMYKCPQGCGRSFAEQALIKHKKVCKKVFIDKRKTFNSFEQRKDLEGGVLGKTKLTKVDIKKIKKEKNNKKIPKWKLLSAQLRKGLNGARGKVTKMTEEDIILQKIEEEDQIECKFCGRKFNEQAGKRHVAFCETKYKDSQFKNKSQPPKPMPKVLSKQNNMPKSNTITKNTIQKSNIIPVQKLNTTQKSPISQKDSTINQKKVFGKRR